MPEVAGNEPLDVEALREEFLHKVFDEYELVLEADVLADFASACGETAAKYTDPSDPDFQAPPTIASSFQPRARYPEGFPTFQGLGMDAGKAVHPAKPMRAGVSITAKTHMHDIYTKTGRSGRMVFFVNRMEFFDPHGEMLGSSDTSIVIREKPQE
ncbi:MAG: MaoC family dehydratase N-terminal domain-containing protein [Pseudomonadota bacterium]